MTTKASYNASSKNALATDDSSTVSKGSSGWLKRLKSRQSGSAFSKLGLKKEEEEEDHDHDDSGKAKKSKKHDDARADKCPRHFTFDSDAAMKGNIACDLFEKEEAPEDFNEIVDLDNERIEEVVSQDLVGTVVGHFWFKTFIIGATVMNAILIGAQTNSELSEKYAWMFFLFDHAVLSIFVWELCLKWYNGFTIYWKVGWNIVDFIVIVVLLLGPILTFMGSSTNFRIIRVLRAFRGLRSVRFSTGLTIVLETLLGSIPDIVNVTILLTIIMVMFGVVGVFLFGRAFPLNFGDIQAAMYTLFICLTQDGWVVVFQEMKNTNYYVIGAFYFIFAITVGVFVFTNLVVAVVISNTDRAIQLVKHTKKMREDVLSTKDIANDSELDYYPVVPISSIKDVAAKTDLTGQKPLYFGDFKDLTSEKYEHYLVVTSALEDNLARYKGIKDEVNNIFRLVWDLNQIYNDLDEPDESPSEREIVSSERRRDSDISYLGMRGDLLAQLLELEEHNPVEMKDWDMSKYIKNAARSGSLTPTSSRSGSSLKSARLSRSSSGSVKAARGSGARDGKSPWDGDDDQDFQSCPTSATSLRHREVETISDMTLESVDGSSEIESPSNHEKTS